MRACGAELMGVDARTALTGMRTVTSRPSFCHCAVREHTARLLLARTQLVGRSFAAGASQTVVLAIDSAAADGRDVSGSGTWSTSGLAGRSVIATAAAPKTCGTP